MDNYKKQTGWLCSSLPNLCPLFQAADSAKDKGYVWIVFGWHNIEPAQVAFEQMEPLPYLLIDEKNITNHFRSGKQALIHSEKSCPRSHWGGHETGISPGVWRWEENGLLCFRTAIPVKDGQDIF